jgi:hypothetical protein
MADKTIIDLDNQITAELQDRLVIVDMNALNTNNIAVGNLATSMFNAGLPITSSGLLINGDLNVNGNINVSTIVSSSVLYQSGSTKFGDSFDDIHQFTGSVKITGSTTQIGNNTLEGNTILNGTIGITGNSTLTGSFLVSGSTTQIGDNTLTGNTWLYGNIDVSGSTNFHNHTITMSGSIYTTGSQIITGSLDVKGNINVASGSDFYLAGNKLFNYGQFSDTTIQSGSANTAYAKRLNTTDFAHNVLIESGSRIKVLNTGIYNLQFSTQLANTANTNITFDIWLAYTGSNVSNTNTQVDVNKSAGQLGRQVAAWNYMLPIQANDYVELMWSCNASTGQLHSSDIQSNPTRPAIPSVIATLTQIG